MSEMREGSNPPGGQAYCTENIRADRWRDVMSSAFPSISMDWLDDKPRPVWFGVEAFAGARVIEIANHRPVHVVCTRGPTTPGDTYDLVLQLAGGGRCRHAGREVQWGTGDLLLFDSALSFDVVHPTGFHFVSWQLPKGPLEPMLAEPDRSVGVRIAGDAGPGAVLASYVRALMTEARRCDPVAQRGLLVHLYGLVGLTLGASPTTHESRHETHRAVRRQQILSYIEAHLRDPGLTAQRAARDLRMSPRWLHALLEGGEISFAAWVARRRLEECWKLLNDPANHHLTVTDIAFRSGFENLSTFNRRFRARYGMNPRDVRRRCAAEGG